MSLDQGDRELLAQTVARVVAMHAPVSSLEETIGRPSGYEPATWGLLAELGTAALLVSEDRGGMEQSMAEVVAVAMEFGKVLMPGPFLGTSVHAAALLGRLDASDSAAALLERIAAGEAVVAVVDGGSISAEPNGDGGWVVDGSAEYVLDAGHADTLLVATSGFVAVVDPTNAVITPVEMADQTRTVATVAFERLPVARESVVGWGAGADTARDGARACFELALAADCVGGADAVLRLAVDYSKTRHQFGRAIGSFQAIKHKLADMYVQVEAARAIVVEAGEEAARSDASMLSSPMSVAAAIAATDAYTRVAGDAIQVHGGIGFTWEHVCHRYFKRAWLNRALLGGPTDLRRRFGVSLETRLAAPPDGHRRE
ncbi:MAG: acyl-CoA dehydrogenase family protein [Microbacterium sp.]